MSEEQKNAYEYIMEKCGVHFMPNKNLFSAHITLGYDYQKYGNSEWEAKDTLATYLSSKQHIQNMICKEGEACHADYLMFIANNKPI